MSKYRIKRFSKDSADSKVDEKEVPETIVGKGIRSVGSGLRKLGRIAKHGTHSGAREIYAGTGSKVLSKPTEYIGKGVKATTGVLGEKIDSVGDYLDRLADDPKKTLKESGEYLAKNPDKAVMSLLPLAAIAVPVPGTMEAGIVISEGYNRARDKVAEKLFPKKDEKKSRSRITKKNINKNK